MRNNLPPSPTILQDPVSGHSYMYVNTPSTWTEARDAASKMVYNGMQGYLATVTSASENAFINANYTANESWIGASDALNEGQWQWTTGPEAGTVFSNGDHTPVTVPGQYSNWSGGEPNNSGNNENYAVMNWLGNPAWNDLNNQGGGGGKQGFIVEFSGNFPAGIQGSGDPTLVSVENYLEAPVDTARAENWCDKAISYVNAVQASFGNNITTLQNRVIAHLPLA